MGTILLIVILCIFLTGAAWLLRRFFVRSAAGPPPRPPELEAGVAIQPPRPPRYVDQNVLFTVYRPRVIAPGKWYTLLALAHLSERRPDAPPDAPDPREQVRDIAERVYGSQVGRQRVTSDDSRLGIPERTALTLIPQIDGIEFNPERVEFKWVKDVHHAEFEFRAGEETEGRTLRGQLTVYGGINLLADVPLALEVNTVKASLEAEDAPAEAESARPYEKIFASYSHKDTAIVEQFEAHVEALGHSYMRDVYSLRSGEEWNEGLKRLIDEAEVFQLFWSWNSLGSRYVQEEWRYALSLNKKYFVRPVYWEDPLPKTADLPPAQLDVRHFHRFRPPAPESARIFWERDKRSVEAPPVPDRNIPLEGNRPGISGWLQRNTRTLIPLAALGVFSFAMLRILPDRGMNTNNSHGGAGPPANANKPVSTGPTPTDDRIIAREPDNYAATIVFSDTQPGGRQGPRQSEIEVARNGADRRYSLDTMVPATGEIIFLDRAGKHYIIVPARRQYAEAAGPGDWRAMTPDNIVKYVGQEPGVERVGNETIDGRPAIKYRRAGRAAAGTRAGDVAFETFIWVDQETRLPLRLERSARLADNVPGDEGRKFVVETRDIRTGVDPALFEVPAGYTRVAGARLRGDLRHAGDLLKSLTGK